MITELLKADETALAKGAELIRRGELVGFPTETVYGLGADAFNARAALKIFSAKGRPADNPLIVHICSQDAFSGLCYWNDSAQALLQAFMPGPITVVLKKKAAVPDAVTAGMDTVAIRFPSHPVAQRLIQLSGTPIAAPSANLSGSPSPTSAAHVYADMNGRIPLIIDGGSCTVGLESTVISLVGTPTLLRPGGVTHEQLERVLGRVDIHPAVLHSIDPGQALSPGMKYKHYSPRARVIIADGCGEALYESAHAQGIKTRLFPSEDAGMAAHNLFALLRSCDDDGIQLAIFPRLPADGMGLSVMNRLLRASAFTEAVPGTPLQVTIDGVDYTLKA